MQKKIKIRDYQPFSSNYEKIWEHGKIGVILMLCSFLLLTGFVFYWLKNRYNYEYELLQKELQQHFWASQEETMDSLLVSLMIEPLFSLKDTVIEFKADTFPSDIKVFFKSNQSLNYNETDSCLQDGKQIRVMMKNRKEINIAAEDPKFQSIMPKHHLQPDNMLRKGVKLLFNYYQDSIGNYAELNIKTKRDTSIMITSFERRIELMKLNAIWFNSFTDNDLINPADKKMVFVSPVFDNSLAVEVKGYRRVIFSKLAPNIFFASMLLLITAIAFFSTYRSLKKQIQLNRIRNDFVSNVAHELKTPVATMKVIFEAMQNYNANFNRQKMDEYIGIASLETERLEKLVNNVLMSAIDNKLQQNENFTVVNMEKIVKSVVSSLLPRLELESAKISVTTSGQNFNIKGNPTILESVLMSIIDNSLKYTEEQAEIIISIEEKNSKVLVSVSDNGIGIPEEYLPNIFDKFFRVPLNNRHNVKGQGLGLSFVAMAMKQHSGAVSVINNKEKGCKVEIQFPVFVI